jgi:hypothetical protein
MEHDPELADGGGILGTEHRTAGGAPGLEMDESGVSGGSGHARNQARDADADQWRELPRTG